MKILFISLSFFISLILSAQDYNVKNIADSIKVNADVVLRVEDYEIKVASPKEAILKHKYALTILNEDGKHYAGYYNMYGKFNKLNKVVAKLYDSTGKLLKTVKKKDMLDMAYNDQVSLISDDRTVRYDFAWKTYPYTIEIEDEEELKGFFSLPEWTPVENASFAVEKSSLTVVVPKDYTLHYKLLKNTKPPIEHIIDKNKTYEWTINNYKAIEHEPFSPDKRKIVPGVLLAPSDFEIDGYKGNLDTWNNFGKFLWQLYKGRDVLPANVKSDIHKITDTVLDIDRKINLLYDYLQQNTHYISIQMGIGGWQPFDAGYVAKNKYGDCKALSNYMIALLKEAGVSAKQVIIKAGAGLNGLNKDFPSNAFNHAVMFIPNGNDTTWLECTSQYESPGFMGSFTGDRDALMLDSSGGYIVHTPVYKASDNIQKRVIKASITADGTLNADINTTFSGVSQHIKFNMLHYANKEQKDKELNAELHLPTYRVESSEYKEHRGKIPSIDEYLKITAENYANVTAKRMFVVPNLIEREDRLDTSKKRNFDIVLHNSFTDIDSIEILIPVGYTIESTPKDIDIKNKFGSYSYKVHLESNTIKLHRQFTLYAGTYPPEAFSEFATFHDAMFKADRSKMVLVKKEN